MNPTENVRRKMVEEINRNPDERKSLEEKHGKVWDTKEVQEDFRVISFLAPFVQVIEKLTGKGGTLLFQDSPRYYFSFQKI